MRMAQIRIWFGLAVVGLLVCLGANFANAQGEFPLKDGDTWIMVGDSITAQRLHTNYIEAFCYARFPNLTFCFRNSGVGGDTIPKVLARFNYDVAAWNPSVVSVELGMNDKGGFSTEKFMENMGTLLGRIREIKARPVLLSPSPVNNGSSTAKLDGGNAKLQEYAAALKTLSEKEKIPYANQFGLLVDFWAANKPNETLSNTLGSMKGMLAAQPNMDGADHLKAFLEVWAKKDKQPVTMMGDAVHPGATGQLTMAAALLSELKAPGLVSTATIDASAGTAGEAVQCKIENVKMDGDKLSFDRLDNSLPFPVPNDARAVLAITDGVEKLSQYMLTVNGLKAARYDVSIDGVNVATVAAADLAKGWNMGLLEKGPIADQCRSILQLVGSKEGIVSSWRNVSKAVQGGDAGQKEQLEKLTQQTKDADAKIRAAAKPKQHRFELSAAAAK
ncbi:MAG TPA: hypothetical protein DCZ94_00670 [Lentisphaeria bacterium]|nr:MAG: hypothetical protein A2X48_12235 [Lentisphaerae bacterium GWF2_49_21]HBC85444.1 hypothetical protein [Lentisphaeria bacterium]